MEREQIFAVLARLLSNASAEASLPEDVNSEQSLKDDLGLNSMEVQDFIIACEKEYAISIPAKDEKEFCRNVGSAVDYIFVHQH